MSFKTSVNIKFDIGKEEFLNRYLPTPSHASALMGLLQGFTKELNRAHIIVGPYGTGKSLLATVVGGIVSKKASRDSVDKLIKKFQNVDDLIADEISTSKHLSSEFIPILLTGNEGRFRQTVITNILRELAKHGINVKLPGMSSKILDTIEMWKVDFPFAYKQFLEILEAENFSYEKFMANVEYFDENTIQFFAEAYPKLTAGATFVIDYNTNFIANLEVIIEELQKKNVGLFLVYDEFGRFLQGLDGDKINETMQDLQDLAEITNRSNLLHVLLITHKSLRQYFGLYNEEVAKEFQRIEKRFSQYYIQSDATTFNRIAQQIVLENRSEQISITENIYEYIVNGLRKFPLFPSMNQTEKEEIIAKGMYPLHPVSLFMLPSLSSVFGQNERTLFTFLESNETGGLNNHMKKSDALFFPHQLFDYFFPEIETVDMEETFVEYMTIYKKIINKIPPEFFSNQNVVNLIKLITIWNIGGLQKEVKLNTEFLSYCMHIDLKELNHVLSELSHIKVVRFNVINGYWELFLGSAINISNVVNEEKKVTVLNVEKKLEILKSGFSKKYIFANEYNDATSMTRFANIEFVIASDILENKLELIPTNESDFTIYYVFTDNQNQKFELLPILNAHKNDRVFIALFNKQISDIEQLVYDKVIYQNLINDTDFIKQDIHLKEELDILDQEISFQIKSFLKGLSNFSSEIEWYYKGEEINVRSEYQLSNHLSSNAYKIYNKTPVINNDNFNKRNISNQQKNAGIKVVDSIINNYRDKDFGISGTGPDYLIYATVFKNNENTNKNVNDLNFTEITYEPYKLLRDALISLLENKSKGTLLEILNIFTDRPFSIRKPLIPILLVSLLRDRWDDLMFYNKDMFIPGIDGDKIYQMVQAPGEYEYVYYHLDKNYIDFFNIIEEIFSEYKNPQLEGKPRLIVLCAAMNSWLKKLPRITQLSSLVNKNFKWLRTVVRKTEISPQASMQTLFEEFYAKGKIQTLRKLVEYGDDYLSDFERQVENDIKEITNLSDLKVLKEWAENQTDYNKKNNKFVNALLKTSEIAEWINKFTYYYVGVNIRDWSDSTHDLFKKQLKYDFTHLNEKVENDISTVTLKIEDQIKVINRVNLSTKAQMIYDNVHRMMTNAGRNVPREEIENMIYKLIEEFVE
ncbi:hypothetical protein ACFVR2_01990 [Gottfriedia sp. NPDC057991]|uniref:hypothetical protein n=1 Tax=Gottfriedia sp. NPDC057991 TaxID=3346298 RepID=UPI0036DA6C45